MRPQSQGCFGAVSTSYRIARTEVTNAQYAEFLNAVAATDTTFFVTSEDEWYKAAYYDPSASVYYSYPAGTSAQTTCATPGATSNTANCAGVVGDVSIVGSYTGSPSPYGTSDQGGNVYEWTEAIAASGSSRVIRGGSCIFNRFSLQASNRSVLGPSSENNDGIGFRVASPDPAQAVPSLGPAGLVMLAALLGATACRKLRSAAPLAR